MTKLEQIERSIAALSPKELKAFAKWFEAFQADVWDKQIEADAKAGRLDGFAKKALAEIRAIMGSGRRFYHAAPKHRPAAT